MSFEYYTNWWIKSKKNLEDLTEKDENIRMKFKPINERCLANALIGGLYAKYCMLVQDLSACVDQMAQPQKIISVKKLVDSACIRLNELNDELRNISISEYHYIDESLIELKLIPYDIEVLHPCLFHHRPVNIEDMVQKIKDGEKIYIPPVPIIASSSSAELKYDKSVLFTGESRKTTPNIQTPSVQSTVEGQLRTTLEGKELGNKEKRRTSSKMGIRGIIKLSRQFAGSQTDFSPEEQADWARKVRLALSLIMVQTAERGRQDRVYFFEKKVKFVKAKELRQPGVAKKEPTKASEPDDVNYAATQIQKVFRSYRDKQNLKFQEDKRRLLIGMTEPSWRSRKEFEIFEANIEKRRKYRDEKIKEYIETVDREQARILRVVAPGLLEDISDEIREWFHQWYTGAKTFDNYPPEEKGGTILVVRGETMTPKEYLDDYEKKRREKVKAGGKDKLKEQQRKEKKKKEEAEKKKKEAEKKRKEAEAKKKKMKKKGGEFEYEYGETLSKELRDVGREEFKKIWNERNPFDNPEDSTYMDLITEQKCFETQLEIRREADELMRLELDFLQEALAKDKGKKYKKKKQKKKRKGKKKGKKDITADRSTEDLFQELVNNEVIRTYPKVNLDEFRGDFSYKNTELRVQDFDPPATSLDVRQAVTLNCIQPLGVETMKKPRSVLIAGPHQSGKHILANAVFYHTQCVLFDLSPEVTADIYPGNKGLAMLIHLVTKMARILQPSVIFFEGAERIFYKKVPKYEKYLDPKRVGKKLIKGIIKTIKPEDRILVLGISAAPWLAQGAKLKKAFDRVLTPRRIIQLKYNPLRAEELYEVLVSNQIEPVSDKEWKKYIKWYNKTPLGKERATFNKWADGKRELEKKQQEKQQKGK